MRVLLFLLLSISTPAVHHVAPIPVPAAAAGVAPVDPWEPVAAKAELATAIGTFLLAIATVVTLWVTTNQRKMDLMLHARTESVKQQAETVAAWRQLYKILGLVGQRVQYLHDHPTWDATALLEGLDVPLSRVLSDDMMRALPPIELTSTTTYAVFRAHDALAVAVLLQGYRWWQNNSRPGLSGPDHHSILRSTEEALDGINDAKELIRRHAQEENFTLL